MGLHRPPPWGIVVITVLVVVNVAILAYFELRPSPSVAARAAVAIAPAAARSAESTSAAITSAAPSSTAAKAPPVIAVYGDGYTTGSAQGGQGDANWAVHVAKQAGATLDLEAASRVGYTARGVTGLTLAGVVAAHPAPSAAVTVVFAGHNDLNSDPAALAKGINDTLQAIEKVAPKTVLVIVGPAWSGAPVPPALLGVRDATQAAAGRIHATFLDPLADHWFTQSAGLVAPDGVSPTDAGHQFVATLLAPVVQRALSAPSND